MIEWQPKVLHSQRDAFETKAIKEGLANFKILEPGESSTYIEAKERPVYFPVLYGVTTKGQKTAIGLDLAWSEERMKSKYEARDSGTPKASNVFDVLHTQSDKEITQGFAISLAVYDSTDTPNTKQERREKLKGFLASVIYIQDLFEPIISKLQHNKLQMSVVDVGTNFAMIKANKKALSKFYTSKTINIYDQEWEIRIYATQPYLSQYIQAKYFISPVFLLIFLIVIYYFHERNEKKKKTLLQTRKELNLALKKSELASQAKMTFLANMSHEIRTPMNAILGYARLIKENSFSTSKSQDQEYIDRMISNGNHLLTIIDDILNISSFEQSKIQLNPHNFNIRKLISNVEDIILAEKKNSHIEFVCTVNAMTENIYGDSVRIRQVLINLLNNSLKFTNEGSIKLHCTVQETRTQNALNLFLEIEDTGIGIDEDYLKDIYNPFTQEDETFGRSQGGVGLGLSIVHNLVSLMEGKIQIKSHKNIGTNFKIDIPTMTAKTEESIETKAIKSKQHINKLESKIQKKILIAEDDEDARILLNTYLKSTEYNVTFVINGTDLLAEILEKNSLYNLILSDIQMPGTDGLSATRTLRKNDITTPIILMSAHALQEEKEKGLAAGANEYIVKPINKDHLIKTIDEYIN